MNNNYTGDDLFVQPNMCNDSNVNGSLYRCNSLIESLQDGINQLENLWPQNEKSNKEGVEHNARKCRLLLKCLKYEIGELDSSRRQIKKSYGELEEEYQTACLSLENASRIVLEKNNVIKKQKETIGRLEQKFNLPSNKSKELTQNSKNSVASGHHRPSSFLEKIKSLKGNLEQCKAVEYSYNSDSKNQQTK